jgi:hypothetical protein
MSDSACVSTVGRAAFRLLLTLNSVLSSALSSLIARYLVKVSANGFATLKREDVTLQVNSPATMNFTMQVATTRVEVEVTSEAPLVNTQDASIGNALNARNLWTCPRKAGIRFRF